MKISPIAKGAPGSSTQTTFKTQQSPSMQEKMRAAAQAPPPPVPAAGPIPAAAAGAASSSPAAGAAPGQAPVTTQKPIVEGVAAPAEAISQALQPQLAALARETRRLRQAQIDIQKREDALKAREADFIPKSRLKDDTLSVLSEAGISNDRLVELQLGQGQAADPVAQLQAHVQRLEQQLAERDAKWTKDAQSASDQARAQAVAAIQRDAELLVEASPAYETIKATGQAAEITRLIEKVFDEEGVMLTVEEAANEVEQVAVERESIRLQKLLALPKIKSKLAPAAPAAEANPTQQRAGERPRQQPQTRTLNNGMGVSRPLTARERAIAAFNSARNQT